MNQLTEHLRYFQELGVTGVSRDAKWRQRQGDQASADPGAETAQAAAVAGLSAVEPAAEPTIQIARSAVEALAAIREDIGDCTRCKLYTGRQQIVFGVGNPAAEIMFVGEAPGADEDAQGVPFVGRAGQLLTKMIEGGMGVRRDEVYIANVVKCRPPGNRNPEPDEIASCQPFLFRQIASVQPRVIIALGAFAARTLLATDTPIGRLRGKMYDFHGATLIPTFHPSFLLRSPGYKREAWEDLKMALGVLGREAPPTASAPAAP